jgi:hypothetical protein
MNNPQQKITDPAEQGHKQVFPAGEFPPGDFESPETGINMDLAGEIEMLRSAALRVHTLFKSTEDLRESVSALGAIGMAATRVAKLLTVQLQLEATDGDPVASQIMEAIMEFNEEMGLN